MDEQQQLREQYEFLREYYVSKYQSLTSTRIRPGPSWPACSTWRPLTPEGIQELESIERELEELKAELSAGGS